MTPDPCAGARSRVWLRQTSPNERCSLCKERMRGTHSHPNSWNTEMQELLTSCHGFEDASKLCVCKADELSIRRIVKNKREGNCVVPRWIKREQKKKSVCVVPGCSSASERSCGFASFAEICSVCNCEASEDVSSDVLLRGQHYRVVHRHYHPDDDVVCALCGARRKHRASVNRTWAFRPIPKPECIEALLHEIGSFEGSLTNSVVCAACYVFCQSALKHEDARSDELIRSELKKQIEQLTVKLNNLDHDSEVSDELALLKTSLHLQARSQPYILGGYIG